MWENSVFLVIFDTCDVVYNWYISLLPPIDNLFGNLGIITSGLLSLISSDVKCYFAIFPTTFLNTFLSSLQYFYKYYFFNFKENIPPTVVFFIIFKWPAFWRISLRFNLSNKNPIIKFWPNFLDHRNWVFATN